MPIFEYTCRDCDAQFETIVNGSGRPKCPSCRSPRLEKRFSSFAVARGSRKSEHTAPSPCGSCGDPRGPGACNLD